MNEISILDYGLGNIFSINECLKTAGFTTRLITKSSEISSSEILVLPGVGAFGVAMDYLNQNNLVKPLKMHVKNGKPLIGICLGMQLLFESSEEHGDIDGLGLIKGHVKKLAPLKEMIMKIPHIGWNEVFIPNNRNKRYISILEKPSENFFYFVHSYHCIPEDDNDTLLISNYSGVTFCAAIKHKNVIGFQFHPENSAENGQFLIKSLPTILNINGIQKHSKTL